MDEYHPCKKPDPTAQEAIGNVMRETRPRIKGARRRKALSKEMRAQVYAMYGGHCAYCGKKIEIRKMQVDHIHPIHRGGVNETSNYRPACRQCNFYKSTLTIEDFREQLSTIPKRLEKQFILRLALAYGLIEFTGEPVKFYFEGKDRR